MNKKVHRSPQWLTGTINWFDLETGRGSILGSDGSMYRIHDFTLIDKGSRLKARAQVEFTLQLSSKNPILERIRPRTKEQIKVQPKRRTRPDAESVI